jgi:hypothetical protein
MAQPGLHDIELISDGKYESGQDIRVVEKTSFYVPR